MHASTHTPTGMSEPNDFLSPYILTPTIMQKQDPVPRRLHQGGLALLPRPGPNAPDGRAGYAARCVPNTFESQFIDTIPPPFSTHPHSNNLNQSHPFLPSTPATGGYFVPAGAVVVLSVTNLHTDPAVWGSDAREYRCVGFLACFAG